MFRLGFIGAVASWAIAFNGTPVSAAQYKGQSMNGERFKAEFTPQGGTVIKGKIKFRSGKKIQFIAHDGTELELRVRPICADTAAENLDACWPNLKVDVDDGSSRGGMLKINK